MQKRKWLSGEALQIAVKRREMKGKESKLPGEISVTSDMQMTTLMAESEEELKSFLT